MYLGSDWATVIRTRLDLAWPRTREKGSKNTWKNINARILNAHDRDVWLHIFVMYIVLYKLLQSKKRQDVADNLRELYIWDVQQAI